MRASPTPTKSQEELDIAWEKHHKQVYNIVHKFRARHPLPLEDLISQAKLGFVEACHTHNPAKSKLSTWVHWGVWYSLQNYTNDEAKWYNVKRELVGDHKDKDPTFDPVKFCSNLSKDASTIIRLVLEPPPDITVEARELHHRPERAMRGAVIEFLRDIGWALSRIAESFSEIKQALKG